MTLLFTGASGFLGNNIKPSLNKQFQITTIGIRASDDIFCNMADVIPILPQRYDVVLHAAGKVHSVPKTEKEKQAFFDVNLQGTKNLCFALEKTGVPKSFIFISTVAVYGIERGMNISEDHPLNGNTPYAKSKIMAECFLSEWCKTNGVILTILRPSLIAGKDAPGNLGAMVKGIKSGKYLSIAGGKARKSILMAEDIALLLPLAYDKGGIFNVCDNQHPSFRELELSLVSQLNKKVPLSIPYWLAKKLAVVGDYLGKYSPINSLKLSKITNDLTFSNEKAKRELNWEPLSVLKYYKM